MITGRVLERPEIQLIWTIDRSEEIHNIYVLEEGALVLKPAYFLARGWPPGEAEKYTPVLLDCFERGGWFYGFFDGSQLVAIAVVETAMIGKNRDLLQLKELHVSQGYRGRGLGKKLFDLSKEIARQRGARGLYISATPSEHTIQFYLRQGCALSAQPDPDLFAFEPEDIHLECAI
jgi:predicted N-acetyltransferase YhbS